MAIEYVNFQVSSSVHAASFTVKQSGMTIRVLPNTFRFAGVDYALLTTQTVTIPTRSLRSTVLGYLVQIIPPAGDPEIAVFVDEVVDDGVDFPYPFTAFSPQYLGNLFQLEVPANTLSLDSIQIQVFRYAAAPPAAG